MTATKSEKRRATLAKTRKKRATQICFTRELKVVGNKLTSNQKEAIDRTFLEAKWLYNHILSSENVYSFDTKVKEVPVKTPDGIDTRQLRTIGAQVKQSILKGVKTSIKSLSTAKSNGKTVGSLRFKSEVNSIDLVQFGTTYRIKSGKVKIQNIPGWIAVNGLQQIPSNADIANAKLVRRSTGLYLKVTCFISKNEVPRDFEEGTAVGIDFGVKSQITDSNGNEYGSAIEESERLKRLQRELSRKKKGSNNRLKTITKIRREYEKMGNRKKDLSNKIVHKLLENEYVYMQDDNLSSWKNERTGKKMQYSVVGMVKSKLMAHKDNRVRVLSRHVPTTATCVCGVVTKHAPDKRTFICPSCGYSAPRDLHAAQNMLRLYK